MKTRMLTMILAALVAGGVVTITGCKKEGSAEKAGAAADTAASDASKAVESATGN